jgi:hypothetical protein
MNHYVWELIENENMHVAWYILVQIKCTTFKNTYTKKD